MTAPVQASPLSGKALTAYLRHVRAIRPVPETTPCECGHEALMHGADGCEGWITIFDGVTAPSLCDCRETPATVYEVARQVVRR